MSTVFGMERRIVCSRELTKRYEEFIRGTIEEAIEWSMTNEIRGEFCLIVEGNSLGTLLADEDTSWEVLSLKEHVDLMINDNEFTSKDAIKEVAKLRGLKKQEVYAAFHEF